QQGADAAIRRYAGCRFHTCADRRGGADGKGLAHRLSIATAACREAISRAASLPSRLREVGYNEGNNIVIEYRSAAWNRELLADLAAELVDRKVDVISTAGPQAALAAREATKTVLRRLLLDAARPHDRLQSVGDLVPY